MWFGDLRNDIRYALRGIAREPLFSLMVVVTLALGIGANAAMFGVIDRLLLRGPEHVREPDRVMRLFGTTTTSWAGENTGSTVNYRLYTLLRDNTRSFEQIAAYTVNQATLGRGDGATSIRVGRASYDFFPLLGVAALRGRFWDAVEDAPPQGRKVAVLGHGLWTRAYSSRSDILGQTIELNGESFEVIGVAPKGFTGAGLGNVDAWIPMAAGQYGSSDWSTTWNMLWLQVVARLKPGITPVAAAADAQSAFNGGYDGNPENSFASMKLSFAPLRFTNQGTERTETTVSRWLTGVAAVVLLIACANVMNLLLARALRRRREVAVRVVLGIGRGRLARLLLTETMLLALIGGFAGLLIAQFGGQFIRLVLMPDVEWSTSPVNLRVLLFTLGATMTTGVIIGLVPVLGVARRDLSAVLRSGVREGGGRASPLRTTLSVAQAALSVLLLVGAGLFVLSLWNVRNLDLGMEPDRVWSVVVNWPRNSASRSQEQREGDSNAQETFMRSALERVKQMPGIESAAIGIGTPFYSAYSRTLIVPGYDSLPELPGGGPYVTAVSPEYFTTFGTSIVRGRSFTDADREGAEPVAIVNENMAHTLWPDEDPLTRCIITSGDRGAPCARIVGIAENARRFSIKEEPAMQYYLPISQAGMSGTTMMVRPSEVSPPGMDLLRREIMRLDPGIMYVDVKPMQELLNPQLRPWQLGATLFSVFGGLALLIAGIGLYSLIAFLVTHRTQEWGVRMALGAQPGDVMRLILRQGLLTVMIGLVIGALAALAAARYVQPLLFGTEAHNPLLIAGVSSVLLVVGVVASFLPARRATRVNPIQALRSE